MKKMIGNKEMLKWVSVSLFTLFLMAGITPGVFAKQGDVTVEGFVGIGTGPDDEEIDFGTGVGGGAGFGYEVVDNLQLRADLSFFKWKSDELSLTDPDFGTLKVTEDLRNIPIFLGGRYFFPVAPRFRPFVELGVSVNLLKVKADVELFGTSVSVSESATKIGVVPGVGVELMVTPQLGLGVDLRYYLIGKGIGDADTVKPSFFSAAAMIAYHF